MNITLPEEITAQALFSHIMEFFFYSNSACIQLAEKQVLENKILESCEKMTDMIEHCRLGENRVG